MAFRWYWILVSLLTVLDLNKVDATVTLMSAEVFSRSVPSGSAILLAAGDAANLPSISSSFPLPL